MTDTQAPTLAETFTEYQAEFFSARNLSTRTRGEYTADLTDLLRAKKIAVTLRKGGSGKMTTAVNLATALHLKATQYHCRLSVR